MMRDIETWWALKKLKETTLRHTKERLSHGEIMAGKFIHDFKDDFIGWLADSSLNGQWILRPFKLWSYKKKNKSREEVRSERIELYSSIVESCIEKNFINEVKREDKKYLHTTSFGDEFISEFWHKKTWKNSIGTAVVIAALIWLITNKIGGAFEQRNNKIYKIQIIPYEQK